MAGLYSDGSVTWYGVPVGFWMIVFAAIASAIVAVLVARRSNINKQRYLDEQLARGWQQLVRQLKHEAEQRGKQRVHETEQLSKQLEHDADQKAKELQHSLRRDIYVEGAAALLLPPPIYSTWSTGSSPERSRRQRDCAESSVAPLWGTH